MKILVTGGSGYIGSSLIKRFRGRFSFVNYDIRHNPKDDVLNLNRLKSRVKGVDGVLHLAAVSRPKWGFSDPYTCLVINILGTINVLEAVRRANPKAWVIFGSSREVFGNAKNFPVTEDSPRLPLNAYAVSKSCGEDLLRQYAENFNLRCLTLRFCGVYTGKKDILDRVVPCFITKAWRKEALTLEGNGEKLFDFVHIDDALDGIFRAIRYVTRKSNGFYDDITLARNSPISLRELANLIIRFTRSSSKIVKVPDRTYDQKGFWGSYRKAQKFLGWTPKISLEEGLKKAIEELKP